MPKHAASNSELSETRLIPVPDQKTGLKGLIRCNNPTVLQKKTFIDRNSYNSIPNYNHSLPFSTLVNIEFESSTASISDRTNLTCNTMKYAQSCCFCFSARTGCLILGVVGVMAAAYQVVRNSIR